MIRVIAIGKKHESWIGEGLERYQKRLTRAWAAEWVLLPHSSLQGDRARQEESERILSAIKQSDFVVLLDETGDIWNSPQLSAVVESAQLHSKPLTFVVGGAYGVSSDLQKRADKVWSLSRLVFPHQLVRLILIEQLYRAQEIASSGSYHHS